MFLYKRWVRPSLIVRNLSLVSPLISINGGYHHVRCCIKSSILGNVGSKHLTCFLHPSKIRGYSTISATPIKTINGFNLVKYYPDLRLKSKMVKENRKLSGVYIIINNETNKFYIGSSMDLGRRHSVYFTNSFSVRNKTMIISKALVKHGHLNFSVGILEYCHPDIRIERENYYFDLLKPEYNVLKVAGSPPIIKVHSTKTRLKMSINSGLAIAVRFKDIQGNNILTFSSLKAAVDQLGVKYEKLAKFVASDSSSTSPLNGRYVLESVAIPKRRISLNQENLNKLMVTDVTLGVPNQTIYSSIADFAKAIDALPNHISIFLSTRKKATSKNIGEPRFYLGKYFIVELRNNSIPSPLPLVIEVTDLEKTTTNAYPTAGVVAKVLGITRTEVVHYLQLKDPKPILGIYSLKKVNSHLLEPNQNQSSHIPGDGELIDGEVNKLENYRKASSIGLEVINIQTSETSYFPSILEAAIKLGCDFSSLHRYLNRNTTKPFKGKFIINRKDSLSSLTEIEKVLKYEVTNLETSVTKGYPSLASISREIGVDSSYLSKYLKNNSTKPIKNKYIVKSKFNKIDDCNMKRRFGVKPSGGGGLYYNKFLLSLVPLLV